MVSQRTEVLAAQRSVSFTANALMLKLSRPQTLSTEQELSSVDDKHQSPEACSRWYPSRAHVPRGFREFWPRQKTLRSQSPRHIHGSRCFRRYQLRETLNRLSSYCAYRRPSPAYHHCWSVANLSEDAFVLIWKRSCTGEWHWAMACDKGVGTSMIWLFRWSAKRLLFLLSWRSCRSVRKKA